MTKISVFQGSCDSLYSYTHVSYTECVVSVILQISIHNTYRYLKSKTHPSPVVDTKQLIGKLLHLLRKLFVSYGVKQLVDVL